METVRSILLVLLGGVSTFSFGLLNNWWQTKQPELKYQAIEAFPFQGDREQTGIYHVYVTNTGTKEAEQVVCAIRVPGAKIDQKRALVPDTIKPTEEVTGDSARFLIDSLNPKERLQLSVVAKATSRLPELPLVSLRGKGITGAKQESESKEKEMEPSQIRTIVFVGFIVLVLIGIASVNTKAITAQVEKKKQEAMTKQTETKPTESKADDIEPLGELKLD